LHHAIVALRGAAKPVIASVHGAVAGAGVSLLARLREAR
jgi:enoyl-CoA hydratase/carnithine racemase